MTIENKILIFLSFLIVFVFTDWILRTIRSIEGVAGQRRRSLRRRVSVDGRRGRSAVSRHLSPMKLDLKRDVVVKRKRVYSLSPRMYLKWSFYLVRKGVLLKYVWNFTQSGLVSSRWCGNYSDAVGWGLKLQRRIEVGDLCNCSWFLVFFFTFRRPLGALRRRQGSGGREVRHEQLLWHRHRRQDHARLPHQTRGASGEVPLAGAQLHVVRRPRRQRTTPGNVEKSDEPRRNLSNGQRKEFRYCGREKVDV